MNRVVAATLVGLTLALGSVPGPASAADQPIIIGVPPWQGAEIKSAVVAEILRGAGYPVEITRAAAPLIFQEMAAGRVDVNLSAWVPGQEAAFGPHVDAGRIEILGENLAGARTGLAVPAAMAEAGIRSLEDLADADGLERTVHCIEPGSGAHTVLEEAIEADLYGLGAWSMVAASTEAMLAQVSRAQRRDEPVVFCAWSPHWMNVRFDLHYLDDPLDHWGGPGRTKVHTLARSGFRDDHPQVVAFLERFRVDAAVQSAWIDAYARREMPAETVARAWLREHPERLRGWLEGVEAATGGDAFPALDKALKPRHDPPEDS